MVRRDILQTRFIFRTKFQQCSHSSGWKYDNPHYCREFAKQLALAHPYLRLGKTSLEHYRDSFCRQCCGVGLRIKLQIPLSLFGIDGIARINNALVVPKHLSLVFFYHHYVF